MPAEQQWQRAPAEPRTRSRLRAEGKARVETADARPVTAAHPLDVHDEIEGARDMRADRPLENRQ